MKELNIRIANEELKKSFSQLIDINSALDLIEKLLQEEVAKGLRISLLGYKVMDTSIYIRTTVTNNNALYRVLNIIIYPSKEGEVKAELNTFVEGNLDIGTIVEGETLRFITILTKKIIRIGA